MTSCDLPDKKKMNLTFERGQNLNKINSFRNKPEIQERLPMSDQFVLVLLKPSLDLKLALILLPLAPSVQG